MDGLKDPKIIVYGALALPVVTVFLEWDISVWFLGGIAALGIFWTYDKLMDKALQQEATQPLYGPREPFVPPGNTQWNNEYDPYTGQNVPRRVVEPPRPQYSPPPYMDQGGQRR